MQQKVKDFRIIGIDPGYDRVGLGVIEKNGGDISYIFSCCIQTNKSDTLSKRLSQVKKELLSLLALHPPHSVGMEKLFFAKNTKTALMVSEAVGVIRLTLEELSIPLYEYTPAQIKIATTGHGSADKKSVFFMVERLLVLPKRKRLDDETDALAACITHAASIKNIHLQ